MTDKTDTADQVPGANTGNKRPTFSPFRAPSISRYMSTKTPQVDGVSPLPSKLDPAVIHQTLELADKPTSCASSPRKPTVNAPPSIAERRRRIWQHESPLAPPTTVFNDRKTTSTLYRPPASTDSGYASDPSSYRSSEKNSQYTPSNGQRRSILGQPPFGSRGQNTSAGLVTTPVAPHRLSSTGLNYQSSSRPRPRRGPYHNWSEVNTTIGVSVPLPPRPSSRGPQPAYSPWPSGPQRHTEYPPLVRGDETRLRRRPSVSSSPYVTWFQPDPRPPNTIGPRFADEDTVMVPDTPMPPPAPRPSFSEMSNGLPPKHPAASKSLSDDMKMVMGRFDTLSIGSSSAADHKRLSDMVFRDRGDMEWLETDMDVFVAHEAVFSYDGGYLPGPFPTRYSGSAVSSSPRKIHGVGAADYMDLDDSWPSRQPTLNEGSMGPRRPPRRFRKPPLEDLYKRSTDGVPHVSSYDTTLPTSLEPFKKATAPLKIGKSFLTKSTLEKVKLQDKTELLDTRDAHKERTDSETRRKRRVDYMTLDAERNDGHADVDADEVVRQSVPEAKVSPSLGDEMEEPIFDVPGNMTSQGLRRSCSVASMESEVSQESARSGETELSFTDSLWLLSEHSNEPEVLGEDHPFFPLKPMALQKVLEGFRAWQKCPTGPSNSSSTATSSKTSDNNQSGTPSRKRPRKNDSEESPENGETEPSKSQKTASKRQKTSEKKLTFACPFSKKDPMRHRDCYKYTLNRIRDVKQHLVRSHRVPLYCPRCMDTFPNEEGRDNHIRDVDCPKRQFIKLDGVTDSHRSQLSKKVPSNISKEDQWFGVFGILFPDQPRPASPYIDNDLLQDITLYQDYLSNHGPRILSDILTSRGAVTWNLPNEERDLAAFQQSILEEGLRAIFERWAGQNGISLPEPAVHSSSASVGQLMSADDDEPSTLPTEDPQTSSIFTDDRQLHEATSSTGQLTAPSELDLAHLGASLRDSEEVWGEDLSTPQMASLTAEGESQLMRMVENGQSEEPYSTWAWKFFQ